ncbi:MAG: hypothetical protein A2359_03485 [Candidatus Moranbacteria bacterium RIFOXYB1_FULL_43_19]|nr:MAG: hypothetical protein A2359_03485 [Candidatus Moranbacteria bacterium RIFOXYB1_FULL_43_19]OGI27912.1 MAG: hypothetical protein A2184_02750 [Candidatus Moranbacteria bacterium RIFOXYA1_FULL_44_7]OGI32527.1 MAG: hypothetical protein A2420_03050 [Candidatus Moranbacteria bacterium RIFOXYC1_FULL_44_13]OGI38149.1 MAG: hypothetical protein A2612_01340 [Candidatus Moranbacteria bacterium RIFOXYD1_FULL_44_12]
MDPTYNMQYSSDVPAAAAGGMALLAGGMFLFVLLFILVIYVLMAISLMKIAKRTNTENAWFAWIPILNLVLMLQIAGRPMWWLIFWLVPIINIAGVVLNFVVWIDIARRLGKSAVWGVLAVLIPIIFMPYLAFSGGDTPAQ